MKRRRRHIAFASNVASLKNGNDVVQHPLDIVVDIAIGDAKNFVTEHFKLTRSVGVEQNFMQLPVRPTIDFNDQARLFAKEVREENSDWSLSHELKAVQFPITQMISKARLRLRSHLTAARVNDLSSKVETGACACLLVTFEFWPPLTLPLSP